MSSTSSQLLRSQPRRWCLLLIGALVVSSLCACSPRGYRVEADRVAYDIIRAQWERALGTSEPFSIERPADALRRKLLKAQELPTAAPVSLGSEALDPIEQWPDDDYLAATDNVLASSTVPVDGSPVQLSLLQALQIGARNSRDFQSQKEGVFQAALSLDLERNAFRGIWSLAASSEISRDLGLDRPQSAVDTAGSAGVTRALQSGATFALSLGVDLINLLTPDELSARGLVGDASISLPLLRGAGRFVVTEPLTQAERDVVYAIYDFERFKRSFAVQVATDYLGVLEQLDQVRNAEDNYRSLISSTRRARRLAESGRLPEIQVDQSEQDELRARNGWISTQQNYERTLDRFKTLLGLPTDMQLRLDRGELDRLAGASTTPEKAGAATGDDEASDEATADAQPEVVSADAPIVLVQPGREGAGPLELSEDVALALAFENRLDLRVAIGRVDDAQRGVVVAADALRADVTLLGSASMGEGRSAGSAASSDADLRADKGRYSALLSVDLPLERTAERNSYRNSLINLERSVRDVQALEDQIKLAVRNDLRTLLEARESLRIQEQAVAIAGRRVASTGLFLRAGRAAIRDVLEAQEDLVAAQNALTSARVQYRVSELQLQRDLDVLVVNENGLWREYTPGGGQ
ncbi:MAG: TolC family protein [Planctomycetota bacterium]